MGIKTKIIDNNNTKSTTSNLNQLIDVVQEDVSSSVSRRKYQVFVTGGIGPGITSSLYQTVYDQDYSLQTANPIMDMTVGLFYHENFTAGFPSVDTDGDGTREVKSVDKNIVSCAPGFAISNGRLSFAKNAVMMREKVNNYRQMAAHLLGNADFCFSIGGSTWPGSTSATATEITSLSTANNLNSGHTGDIIHEALFCNVKRLFARDGIRKETFAMRIYRSASLSGFDGLVTVDSDGQTRASFGNYYLSGQLQSSLQNHSSLAIAVRSLPKTTGSNISYLSEFVQSGSYMPFLPDIVADIGAQQNLRVSKAGDVARILVANGQEPVGLLFYDAGIAVFDMRKLFWSDQSVLGPADAMISTTYEPKTRVDTNTATWVGSLSKVVPAGMTIIGANSATTTDNHHGGNTQAKFIPDFLVSASIDNIIDHIGKVRFGSGSLTAMAFQNQTKIKSNIYFCRAEAAEFNYSGNPTYIDSTGQLNVLESVDVDSTETSFTFITGVGLYNSQDELLAVAKLNRPIEKNDETELTLRIRLDF
tara:strand:+ start:1853 stop:3451 length:1599 start_codon:yes stop_codon:yes gene_type:complete